MRKRSLFVAIGLLLIFACAIIFYKIKVAKYEGDIYIKWSDKQVTEEVQNLVSDTKVKLTSSESKDTTEVPISDLGIDFKLVDSSGQEITNFPRLFDLNEVLLYYIEDEGVFKQYFKDLNKNLSKSENAYYEITDKDIILHKEIIGTKVDTNKLYNSMKDEETLNKAMSDSIDLSAYAIQPKRVESDFSKSEGYLDKLRVWNISYNNKFSLGFKDLVRFISVKKTKVNLNEEKFKDYLVDTLPTELSSYNTVGKTRKFKTHSGKVIKMSSGTYGDTVNIDAEIEYILDKLDKAESETKRKPELLIDVPDKIPSTYIEVSIESQHLWYYKNGKLKMESPVVTGTRGVHNTPRGIYYISEKIPGKYLTGDTYRTWVNRWMRLTNMGVGLHDATWRSNFGGSIYTYSGSHGCINLPYSFAVSLYNAVDWKTAVIIY